MRTPKCSVCGSTTNLQSERWPSLWLCRFCITQTLRALWHLGIPLANNALVFELCDGTHYSQRAAFSFYPEPEDPECKLIHLHFDSHLMKNMESIKIPDKLLDILDEL